MSNGVPLRVKNILKNAKVGNYMQFVYSTSDKEKLEEQIKENIDKEYDFFTETKKGNLNLINIYTKKSVYQIQGQTIKNRFERYKEWLKYEELTREIQSHVCRIYSAVIDKFKNKNIKKIEEVIHRFLAEGTVKEVRDNLAYFGHHQHDVLLVIDFHNYVVQDIATYRKKEPVKNNSVLIRRDKMRILTGKTKPQIKKQVLLNQLDLLCSNVVNEEEAKQDIRKNLMEVEVDEEEKYLIVQTKNCKYVLSHYNIIAVEPVEGFSLSEAVPMKLNDSTTFCANKQNEEFMMEVSVQDYYGNKARKYLYKFGLSIKVITKFNTERKNINELYDFLMEDLICFGYMLYDNYMENCMIIRTKRFYYLIKNNVIINLKGANQKPIEECSILFKKVYVKEQSKKVQILDLEIGDRVRDYITYEAINKLQMKYHAIQRYKERITRKEDSSFIEMAVKQDIYKHGVVYMGTYYNDTKLVKGLKNVYIIDNYNIISVWRINPVIENIGERYQNLIEEITLTEVDDSEIL